MRLPFTAAEFFDVFARYNLAVWPAQWLLYGLALTATALVIRRPAVADRAVNAILAVLWLWMGAVYHLGFFAAINPVATLFGAAFIAQAAIFLSTGVRSGRLAFRLTPGAEGIAGGALVAYALVAYPVIGYLSGHRYPAMPTFGVPCPTTIFTCALLLWTAGRVPWSVVFIPVAWAGVGTFAAFRLSVPQDYGLLAAGVAATVLLARRRRSVEQR